MAKRGTSTSSKSGPSGQQARGRGTGRPRGRPRKNPEEKTLDQDATMVQPKETAATRGRGTGRPRGRPRKIQPALPETRVEEQNAEHANQTPAEKKARKKKEGDNEEARDSPVKKKAKKGEEEGGEKDRRRTSTRDEQSESPMPSTSRGRSGSKKGENGIKEKKEKKKNDDERMTGRKKGHYEEKKSEGVRKIGGVRKSGREKKSDEDKKKSSHDLFRERERKKKDTKRKLELKKRAKEAAALNREKKRKADDREGSRAGFEEDEEEVIDDSDKEQFYVARKGNRSRSGSPAPTTLSRSPGARAGSELGGRSVSRSRTVSRSASPELGGSYKDVIDQGRLMRQLTIQKLKREAAEKKEKEEERKMREQMDKQEAISTNAAPALPEKIRVKPKVAMRNGRDPGIMDGPSTAATRPPIKEAKFNTTSFKIPRRSSNGSAPASILDSIEMEMNKSTPEPAHVDRSHGGINPVNQPRVRMPAPDRQDRTVEGSTRNGGANANGQPRPAKEMNTRQGRSPPRMSGRPIPSSSSSFPSSYDAHSMPPSIASSLGSNPLLRSLPPSMLSFDQNPFPSSSSYSSSSGRPSTTLSSSSSRSDLRGPSNPSGPAVLDTRSDPSTTSVHPSSASSSATRRPPNALSSSFSYPSDPRRRSNPSGPSVLDTQAGPATSSVLPSSSSFSSMGRPPTALSSPSFSPSDPRNPYNPYGPTVLNSRSGPAPSDSIRRMGEAEENDIPDGPASPTYGDEDDNRNVCGPDSPVYGDDDDRDVYVGEDDEDGYGRVQYLDQDDRAAQVPMPIHGQSELNRSEANQTLAEIKEHLEEGRAQRVLAALNWKLSNEGKIYFDRMANRDFIFELVRESPLTPTLIESLDHIIRWDRYYVERSNRIKAPLLREDWMHSEAKVTFLTLPSIKEDDGKKSRKTPLSEAVRVACYRETASQGFQWAQFLLKNGARVNDIVEFDDFEGYIIHYAIENADQSAPEFDIIHLLLAYGANRASAKACLESMKGYTIRHNIDGISEDNFDDKVTFYRELHSILEGACDSVSDAFRDQLHIPEFFGLSPSYVSETVCTLPYEKFLTIAFQDLYEAEMKAGPSYYPPVFAVVAGIALTPVAKWIEDKGYRNLTVDKIKIEHGFSEPLFELYPCAKKEENDPVPEINSIKFEPLRDHIGVFIIPRRLYPHLKSVVLNIMDCRVGTDKVVFGGLFRLNPIHGTDREKLWQMVEQMSGAKGGQFDEYYKDVKIEKRELVE